MAMTDRQVKLYGSMSFEDVCDLIDQYKDDEENSNEKIDLLEKQIEEMQSAINELQSDIYNGRNL